MHRRELAASGRTASHLSHAVRRVQRPRLQVALRVHRMVLNKPTVKFQASSCSALKPEARGCR